MDTTVDMSQVQEVIQAAKSSDPTKVIGAILILVIGLIFSRLAVKLIDRLLKKYKVIPAVTSMLRTMIRFVIDLIVVMFAANTIGIPITSFVAVFSVVGIAISLAVQGILSNLAGGLIIMTVKTFEIGQFVETDGYSGTVTDITLMYTKLLTPDGRVIFVPNSTTYTNRIINYSMNPQRRVELSVSASYDNSPDEVRKALKDAIRHVPQVLADPEPVIHVESYGDSAINYTLWVWVNGSDFLSVKYQLNEELYEAFKRNQVEMTYPHLRIHMEENGK